MSVTVGLKGRAETVVSDSNTAQAACSGALPVFGTPFMCALMEEAAWKSIAPHLEEGQSTVGTRLDISHDSAIVIRIRITLNTLTVAAWSSCILICSSVLIS